MGKKGRSRSKNKSQQLKECLKTVKKQITHHIEYLEEVKNRTNGIYYEQVGPQIEDYDPNEDYHSQFWKVFFFNEALLQQTKGLAVETDSLRRGVQRLQEMFDKYQKILKQSFHTKHRRVDSQICKKYLCPYPDCSKVYGTDTSLNLHIKIKHNGGTKNERMSFARHCLDAKQKGLFFPTTDLNIPPCYLKELMDELQNELLLPSADYES